MTLECQIFDEKALEFISPSLFWIFGRQTVLMEACVEAAIESFAWDITRPKRDDKRDGLGMTAMSASMHSSRERFGDRKSRKETGLF